MADTNVIEIEPADVEILEPDSAPLARRGPVHIVALTNPFNFERRELDVTGELTITELLARAGIPPGTSTVVFLNGHLVPSRGYKYIRPKPGTHLLVRVVPQGGRSGGIGKTIAGVVLIIVGIVIGLAEPYGLGWTQGVPLIMFGASLLVSGIINILIPPTSPPRLRALSGTDNASALSPALSIGGGKNAFRPYQKVPRVIGRHRIFPPPDATEMRQ
jgi:sulfur carrier protein ThiS